MGEVRSWYILETAGGDKAADFLSRAGHTIFSATFHKKVVHQRNKSIIHKEFQLFPGYLFIFLPEFGAADWRAVYSTPGVIGALGVEDAPAPIREGIVEALRADCKAGKYDDGGVPPPQFKVGQGVIVLSGPMSRKIAIVKSVHQNTLRVQFGPDLHAVTVIKDMVQAA